MNIDRRAEPALATHVLGWDGLDVHAGAGMTSNRIADESRPTLLRRASNALTAATFAVIGALAGYSASAFVSTVAKQEERKNSYAEKWLTNYGSFLADFSPAYKQYRDVRRSEMKTMFKKAEADFAKIEQSFYVTLFRWHESPVGECVVRARQQAVKILEFMRDPSLTDVEPKAPKAAAHTPPVEDTVISLSREQREALDYAELLNLATTTALSEEIADAQETKWNPFKWIQSILHVSHTVGGCKHPDGVGQAADTKG